MTREEAIQHFKDWREVISSGHRKAVIDMAIEALQREEAEEKGWCHRIRPKNVEVVVRCKDCRYRELDGEVTHFYWCRTNDRPVDDDDFCAWGECKGGDE